MFSAYFMQEFVWELFISSNQNDFFLIILNRIWHDLKAFRKHCLCSLLDFATVSAVSGTILIQLLNI